MRKVHISLFVIFLLSLIGCEDSNNITNNPNSVDGLSLLGLSDGKSFVYLETDTIITSNPFTITVKDTTRTVRVAGSGDDWIIYDDTVKIINLKVGASSVIQNGYWQKINNVDTLIYIAIPPKIMERSLSSELAWNSYTPFYKNNGSTYYLPFYFANFGFEISKTYSGLETIITPAGEFNAYRFDLQLYTTAFGETPVAEITEFYVPQIGLVRQDFNNGALHRSIILATYSN